MKRKITAACLILLLAVPALAARPDQDELDQRLTAIIDFTTWIDVNKILMFVTNKGSFAYDNGVYFGKADGLYFPYSGLEDIGTGANTLSVIYGGSIWAAATVAATHDGAIAEVGDTLVTSGQHDTDWGVGPLIDGAAPPNAVSNPAYRVYKLYVDSLAHNPNQDYLDWPVEDGAPVDENGDPLMIGDQMCWSVYNDLDVTAHVGARGTIGKGLGLEVRQTAWAYAREGALANIVFMKFQIYNEGPYDLSNMFVSLWADPDLGDASDDFVGCDSARSLGYCYNEGADADYGPNPPAVGYDVFQGPLVHTGNDADTALMWGATHVGYQNMPMSSFGTYRNPWGPVTPEDSYRFMNGYLKDGSDLIHPVTGEKTKFFGTGDPVTGDPSGFYDNNSSDRRYMQSVGPIDFAQGDSTEIVVAIICGHGANHLASITELRAIDDFAQELYDNNFQPYPPTAPIPDYPPDTGGMPVFEMLPTFLWGGSTDPNPRDTIRYKLEIALDPNFTHVNTIDSLDTNWHQVTDSLLFNTHYWWRVTAFDNTGLSARSLAEPDFWTWTLGDIDHNHQVDAADLVFLVDFMFGGGPEPYPMFVADINGDCSDAIDISDLMHIVYYVFRDGPPPRVGCSPAVRSTE